MQFSLLASESTWIPFGFYKSTKNQCSEEEDGTIKGESLLTEKQEVAEDTQPSLAGTCHPVPTTEEKGFRHGAQLAIHICEMMFMVI